MAIEALLKQLTLEEKASLCSGKNFWNLKSIDRLGIPSIMVADGPHGLRKQMDDSDNIGLNASVPATCFPTAATLAASWDRALLGEIGKALGETCQAERVSVILGPGINIKRSPLCGRNFEYFSEDPLLAGELAAAMIDGVQSQGIGTSLKHFAVNNQEANRMTIDAFVDQRTLRELYLTGFEIAVKKAQPWTVMCSYNRLNGEYTSEHKGLLTHILKEEWGHEGLIVTDWGATNDRVSGLKAGLELEMPNSGGFTDAQIVSAVNEGSLDVEILNDAVRRILTLIFKSTELAKLGATYDQEAQHTLARRAAAESTVLLKNEGSLLPFVDSRKSIALIGQFAKQPRYQGAGSSLVTTTKLDTAYDAYIERTDLSIPYAQGYDVLDDMPNQAMINEAVALSKTVDYVVLMVGLTDAYESEGFDRVHLDLPKSHSALIDAVLKANPDTVVVLNNGSPVLMPWLDAARAVLECYLPGQAGGNALWDVLFGDINPSGKLAETFPLALEDIAASNYFPMGPKGVEYRESVYVGYRYFDKAKQPVMFPFGYGLSYTTFEYSALRLSKSEIQDLEALEICVDVTNVGDRTGKEIVQLYVRDVDSTIFRPDKELKGFEKLELKPGETKTATFVCDKRAFAYYNVHLEDWVVETGTFEILIGASSSEIRSVGTVKVTSTSNFDEGLNDQRDTLQKYYNVTSDWDVTKSDFETLYGKTIVYDPISKKGSFNRNTTIQEIQTTFVGRQLYKVIGKQVDKMFGDVDAKQVAMIIAMINELPLRNLSMTTGGKVTSKHVDALIDVLNGHVIGGVQKLLNKN
jgi:beta-glucosidase